MLRYWFYSAEPLAMVEYLLGLASEDVRVNN